MKVSTLSSYESYDYGYHIIITQLYDSLTIVTITQSAIVCHW